MKCVDPSNFEREKGVSTLIFRLLVLTIIIVPIVEIWGILQVGHWVGAWPTVFLIVATGVIGGYLAKRQGLQTLRLVQLQIEQRQMPGEAILDGICILIGGLMLLAPGFFTDAIGFVLLLPWTRGIVKLWLKRWFNHLIRNGKFITLRRY